MVPVLRYGTVHCRLYSTFRYSTSALCSTTVYGTGTAVQYGTTRSTAVLYSRTGTGTVLRYCILLATSSGSVLLPVSGRVPVVQYRTVQYHTLQYSTVYISSEKSIQHAV